MLKLYVALLALATTSQNRAQDRLDTVRARDRDRGSISLEAVVIALGLFLVAGLVVAGLGKVILAKLKQIH